MSSVFPLGPSNLHSVFKYSPNVKQIKISGQIVFKYLVIPVNNMCIENLYFCCVPNCHIWLWICEYSRYCTTGVAQAYCAQLFVLPVCNEYSKRFGSLLFFHFELTEQGLPCLCTYMHLCAHRIPMVMLGFQLSHETGTWKEKDMKGKFMKRGEPFDEPCIFMCCTLPSHFASLPYMRVNAYVYVSASKPSQHRQRSLPVSQLYHYLCLHPLFITNPLATCLYCQTVLLPCSVFSVESISLHHTSARLGKIAK